MIAGLQQAEKSLTKDMQATERENTCGGWLAGLEHRLKGEDRLKEKIAEKLGARARQDSLRGRYERSLTRSGTPSASSRTDYADGYWDVKQRLEAREYQDDLQQEPLA